MTLSDKTGFKIENGLIAIPTAIVVLMAVVGATWIVNEFFDGRDRARETDIETAVTGLRADLSVKLSDLTAGQDRQSTTLDKMSRDIQAIKGEQLTFLRFWKWCSETDEMNPDIDLNCPDPFE